MALALACATSRPGAIAPEDPYSRVVIGAMAERDRRFGEAFAEFEAAAQATDDPYLWHRAGTLALRMGDVHRAAAALARAATHPGAEVAWLRQAAAVHGLAGRPRDALKIHLRILEARPGDPAASVAAARILLEHGLADSAQALLVAMDPPWPQDPRLAIDRATMLLSLGRPDVVMSLCDSASIDLDLEGRLLCAAALAAMDRAEEAAAVYRTAASRGDEGVMARSFEALLRIGRSFDAAEVAASALARYGPDRWVYREALALVLGGALVEAQRILERRLRDAPSDAEALDLLSLVCLRLGQVGRAESLLRQGMARVRDALHLRRRLVSLYHETDRPTEALRLLSATFVPGDSVSVASLMAAFTSAGYPERALALCPNPLASEDIAFQTGAAWERLACVRRSAEVFEALLRRNPRHAPAYNYLGYMLAERTLQVARAESLIQCALRLDPDNPYYLDSLGWAYFQQARIHDARIPLERAHAIDPDEPEIMKHLGVVLLALGERERGTTLLRQAAAKRPWDVELQDLLREVDP